MSDELMLQLIADRLAGYDYELPAGEMAEPWKTLWARMNHEVLAPSYDLAGARRVLQALTTGLPHQRALVAGVLHRIPEEPVQYPSLGRLAATLEPIAWLWEGWIPRGMLTLLGASPGAGKSLVALDLARRIIHGEAFPDGQRVPAPGRAVIYVDAEAVPQIQAERAKAWGMDLERLYLMLPPGEYAMVDLGDPVQQDHLVGMCTALEPELVVVDSLSAISAKGENAVEDVRALLGFLTSVAREYRAGLVLIHHLRKRNPNALMDLVGPDDFRGSTHIIAMARSVMALSVVQESSTPNRNGPRRLEVIKTNLCQYPPALGLALRPGLGAPVLEYGEAPTGYRADNETERCAQWLVDLLGEEPEDGIRPREVVERAEGMGWGRSTLYKARESLGDAVVDVGPSGPGRSWKLVGA
jgi:hypothetical protein